MKLTVELGASSEASFDILLNDNDFVYKWLQELQWCLDHCEFEQQEAFASMLSMDQAAEILKQSCITINQYVKNFIEVKDDILAQPKDYFNYLHTKFEKISGLFGKPTRLFAIACPELKQAIRNLNFYIHKVEKKENPEVNFYMSFNKDQYRRQPMEDSDYEYCEFKFEPGTLFVHYAELGKDFFDLFNDGLDVSYPGFKNLHYYSGESWMVFQPVDLLSDPRYIDWLTNQGIDPYNKHLGHYKISLGKVIDIEDTKRKLQAYPYINKILIKE
jgi:hypothetical protein